ncbi:hypothetical protein JTB14_032373 [Gonioctena quinquepunctata]|nr:hypothetical protein JTB14_032373 [Gonioctena quinquepunctata]
MGNNIYTLILLMKENEMKCITVNHKAYTVEDTAGEEDTGSEGGDRKEDQAQPARNSIPRTEQKLNNQPTRERDEDIGEGEISQLPKKTRTISASSEGRNSTRLQEKE